MALGDDGRANSSRRSSDVGVCRCRRNVRPPSSEPTLALSGPDGTRGRREEGPVDEFGFHLFLKRGGVATNEPIDRLREEVGD